MSHFQAGLHFLEQLPKLAQLCILKPVTLIGTGKLTQVTRLDICGCQEALDMYPLALLHRLGTVSIMDCKAEQLANISELRSISHLTVDQLGVHQHISRLSALKNLTITQDDAHEDAANTSAWDRLSALTTLVDNALGRVGWHSLSRLVTLDITTCPTSYDFELPSTLRALGICTGHAEVPVIDSLAPLSALSSLEHLDLTGQALPLPSLGALTMLTLQFTGEDGQVPSLSGMPCLEMLELWLDHKQGGCSRSEHMRNELCRRRPAPRKLAFPGAAGFSDRRSI